MCRPRESVATRAGRFLAQVRRRRAAGGRDRTRLAGFAGVRVPWGVSFAGPGQCRFRKDLRLQPVPGGRGYRLDLADEELLTLGLGLERELDRCARFCQQRVRSRPALPKLWAGFSAADAAKITGAGPELEEYSRRTGRSPRLLLQQLRKARHTSAIFGRTKRLAVAHTAARKDLQLTCGGVRLPGGFRGGRNMWSVSAHPPRNAICRPARMRRSWRLTERIVRGTTG